MARERLPDRRQAETADLWHGGRRYHLTVGEYPDGSPGEVFVHGATPGSLVSPVPLPAALPLFVSALAGLGLMGWRRRQAGA